MLALLAVGVVAAVAATSALAAAAPTVDTSAATSVTTTSAQLNGSVNPNGSDITDCHFDYGTTTAYGQTVPCVEAVGSGTQSVSVHADLTGLEPKTSFNYRLVATNDQGTVNGGDQNTTCGCYYNLATTAASLSTNQAGAHADFTTSFTVNGDPNNLDFFGQPLPWANTRDITIQNPPGLNAVPPAFPTCSLAVFVNALDQPLGSHEQCPQDSQIGVAQPGVWNFFPAGLINEPLYLLESPGGDTVARFGFFAALFPVIIDIKIDPQRGFATTAEVRGAPAILPLTGTTTTIWGVPTDPSHDDERMNPLEAIECGGVACNPASSGLAQTAFLSNPTSCGPAAVGIQLASYGGTSATPASVSLGNITGCDKLPFAPSATLTPTNSAADSPSGIDATIGIDQSGMTDPNGLAPANLKKAVVTLPQGFALNTSAADGLAGCTEAQIGLTSVSPIQFDGTHPTCPDASKVGTAEIKTPSLPDPLEGSLYLADQTNNPFGQPPTLAGYLVAEGDGAIIKAAGRFDLNPQTGQIVATFDNNPQQPFTSLHLHFNGGPRGIVTTPPSCGAYPIETVLTPWSGTAPVTQTTPFSVDQGCATGGFSPAVTAGLTNPSAGSSSQFVLEITRQDGQQNISSIDTVLPPGLVAKLAGVPLCTDEQAATGDCPAGSQVGSTIVATGSGPHPLYIPQAGNSPTAVYLAGPYDGAPYSLVIKVPAQAGPFDLGTVSVRAGIYVDPTTAQVTVKADPLPQIIRGIPLQYRNIRVIIDRPGFMRTPTSCNAMQVSANVSGVPLGGPVALNSQQVGFSSAGGTLAHMTDRFQVGDCSSLGFSPRLNVALSGKGKTRSGDHPTLTATLTQGAGQANIHTARVALPLSLALDPSNSQHVCAFPTAQAVHGGSVGCPASTVVGKASVVTPLLSQPLTGKVYLVQGIRFSHGQLIRTLPSLLIPLRGQIALDLRAKTSVSGGKLVTTFSSIPDAPVSKFVLSITGGRKGLLVITGRGRSICGKAQMTNASLGAQSGKTMSPAVKMSTPCPAVKHAKHKQ